MNLIDAVKSGRPFRRKAHSSHSPEYFTPREWVDSFGLGDFENQEVMVADILADDYELEEPEVRITRGQLLGAFADLLKEKGYCYYGAYGERRVKPGDFEDPSDIVNLAKRLGLEP
jgi:hypothetical protein